MVYIYYDMFYSGYISCYLNSIENAHIICPLTCRVIELHINGNRVYRK